MHEFRLRPPPPFNFEATASFLSPRPGELVDVFDGKRYTRLLEISGRMRLALVSSLGTDKRPELIVTLMNGTERDEPGVVSLLTRMLGLSYDLRPFYALCRGDQEVYGMSSDYYGLKPSQRMHPFEALVMSVCRGSERHAFSTSLSELALAVGYKVAYAGDTFYSFPGARALARAAPEELVHGDVTLEQATNLQSLAQAAMAGRVELVRLARAPTSVIVERLSTLPGVGLLGGQLTALIGYGRLDAFPSADPAVRGWIRRSYDHKKEVDLATAERFAEPWGNYRGLVAFHVYAELRTQGLL